MIRYMIRSKVSLLYLIDLDKAYDRVQREELWHCMKESGVAKENMRVVKKMYENSKPYRCGKVCRPGIRHKPIVFGSSTGQSDR